jgi:hypothetical protein
MTSQFVAVGHGNHDVITMMNTNAMQCVKQGDLSHAMTLLSNAISILTNRDESVLASPSQSAGSYDNTNQNFCASFSTTSPMDTRLPSAIFMEKSYAISTSRQADTLDDDIPYSVPLNVPPLSSINTSTKFDGTNEAMIMYNKAFYLVSGLTGAEMCAVLLYNFALTCQHIGLKSGKEALVQHSSRLYLHTLALLDGIRSTSDDDESFLIVLVFGATCHNLSCIYTSFLHSSHATTMAHLVWDAFAWMQRPTIKHKIDDDDLKFFGNFLVLSNFALSSLLAFAPAA